jgi:hypothetical protein
MLIFLLMTTPRRYFSYYKPNMKRPTKAQLEKNVEDIEQLMNKHQEEQELQKYEEVKEIFAIAKKFIRDHELVLYGGFALNEILPPSKRFYDEHKLPDYDCFHYDAKDLIIKLANLYHRKGYKYVYVKRALHDGTQRIYVNFIEVMDMSYISNQLYTVFCEMSRKDYADSDTEFIIAPLAFLKYSLHDEMSRPISSSFRWSKLYPRLALVDAEYFIGKNSSLPQEMEIEHMSNEYVIRARVAVKEYAIKHKLPIGGCLAGFYHLQLPQPENISLPRDVAFMDAFAKDPKATSDHLYRYLNNAMGDIMKKDQTVSLKIKYMSNKKKKIIFYFNWDGSFMNNLLPPQYDVYMKTKGGKFKLCSVYDGYTQCTSLVDKPRNGMHLLTIDGICKYLFAKTIVHPEARSFYEALLGKIHSTIFYGAHPLSIKNRLNLHCFGEEVTKEDIQKERWDKRTRQIVYIP